ncbi:hypothetical protein E5Q_02857 [Mixia osmundae IAM 14324]|uniref:Uncharacterized protein n=1 Tax=Mixia osmundae (strain CBS 9802 / IAM 14324 / JCM 22182 / KY 12970) TaxID=764103 RepID=G7E033_MIXOS|nr:hypothetical protein E5Q_02857 [Mixia osmundae IAM 14324]
MVRGRHEWVYDKIDLHEFLSLFPPFLLCSAAPRPARVVYSLAD